MTPPTVAELREEVARLERARDEVAESALQLTDDEVGAENLAEDMAEVERELQLAQARLDRALVGAEPTEK